MSLIEGKENKTGPEIPSFSEWTQKALEEEQKKREEDKRKREEEKEKKKLKNSGSSSTDTASARATPEKENATRSSVPEVHPGTTPQIARLKKNFASLDCGAKVAAANAEAQSPLNIITASR